MDGNYGTYTALAVKAFQGNKGIQQDGAPDRFIVQDIHQDITGTTSEPYKYSYVEID